jgi:uncharacterized protein
MGMILDLDRQEVGRSQLELAGEIDLGLGDGRPGPAKMVGNLTVQNLEARVLVKGSLEATGATDCGRCLEAFDCHWPVVVDLMVLRNVDSDEEEGETLVILQSDGEVDLSDAVRECAVLAFPPAPICREECRGLCPTCGVDRNKTECTCKDDDFDPRWEGLP